MGGCQRDTSWARLPSSPGGREQRLCPWRRRANGQEGFGPAGTPSPGEEPDPITSLVPNGHIKGPNPLIFRTQKTRCPSLSLSVVCLPSGNTCDSDRPMQTTYNRPHLHHHHHHRLHRGGRGLTCLSEWKIITWDRNGRTAGGRRPHTRGGQHQRMLQRHPITRDHGGHMTPPQTCRELLNK